MLINAPDKKEPSIVKFISYDGKYPNLCTGTLILEVNGRVYEWRPYKNPLISGGGLNANYEAYCGEWKVDYGKIPDEIKMFTEAIGTCINKNIERGCCGGCS